jgi:ferredoxin
MTIVDGVLSMEGDGPRNGKARLTNLILLSEDVFSLDWVASEIIGLKPILVPTNKEAYVRGLVKPENIEITGIPLKNAIIKDFEMIHKPVTPLPLPTVVNSFLENYIAGKPYFDDNLCNKCLTCVKNCPAKALKKVNGKIEIDRKNCIKCYCCAEFCPNGAVKIKYSWLSRWLRTKIK